MIELLLHPTERGNGASLLAVYTPSSSDRPTSGRPSGVRGYAASAGSTTPHHAASPVQSPADDAAFFPTTLPASDRGVEGGGTE